MTPWTLDQSSVRLLTAHRATQTEQAYIYASSPIRTEELHHRVKTIYALDRVAIVIGLMKYY
jgi:hypothetical protein